MCRLHDVVIFAKRGKSPIYTDDINGISVIAQKCNQWNGITLEKALRIKKSTFDTYSWDKISISGDVIINSTGGGTVGRVGYIYKRLIDKNCFLVPDSHITTIRCGEFIVSKYIYYYFLSPTFQKNINEYCEGSTNQIELYSKTLLGLFFPLAPLNVQKNIVHRIDNIFNILNE